MDGDWRDQLEALGRFNRWERSARDRDRAREEHLRALLQVRGAVERGRLGP